MRYSYTTLALALALATATQITAQPNRHAARHGHAAFHAKKDAVLPIEKRDPTDWSAALANVDWSSALNGVDWSDVDYSTSKGQTYGDATQAPAPVAATSVTTTPTSPAYVAPEASTTAASEPPATTEAPSTTLITSTSSTPPSYSSSVAAAATTSSSSGSSFVSDILEGVQEVELLAFGVISAGINALSSGSADVWIGDDGDYTMEIKNQADEGIYLAAWGPSGSWINANVPLVTLYLPSGSSKTLSFTNGASGALSALYSDTKLVNGQVSNTWVEFTMGDVGVFDVSKEVNMNGHSVEVVGPECTSNMTTCVFQCQDTSVTSCEYDYELVNCANGSQSGAQYGKDDGADSGGCGGLGSSAAMTATFM